MCDSAAPIVAFAREISTVVHPLATHARCDHVDLKLGSLKMGRLGADVTKFGEGLSRGSMTNCSRLGLGLVVVVVVVVEQYTRVRRSGEWHVWTWYLEGYLC